VENTQQKSLHAQLPAVSSSQQLRMKVSTASPKDKSKQ